MKRILLAERSLDPPGGARGLAAWMTEALKHEYRLTLLTWARPDLEAVNRFFGTDLHDSDFTLELMRPWAARLAAMPPPGRMTLLRHLYLVSCARRRAASFDAVIGTNNEADVGPRGIQYFHFPRFIDRPKFNSQWRHRAAAPAMRAYQAASRLVTGFSVERMRRNLTMVNSDFTGRLVREVHGIETVTVYPPAVGTFPDTPWNERKNGFVCVGRIAREKRIEVVIDILAAVRQAGDNVRLHLVGTGDASGYAASIRRLIEANASWVHLHEDLSRAQLVDLITANRYGIHGMLGEPFGMAVAELVSGGCITFVPDSGGPVEIVGNDQRLMYSSREDAVAKILRALREPEYQAALHRSVVARKDMFSSQRFVTRIRKVISDFFRSRPELSAIAPVTAVTEIGTGSHQLPLST